MLFFFKFIKSFLTIFIKIPIGVTTKKYTIAITIGAIKFPKKIPNLNQALLRGVSTFEFNNPRTRNITEIITDQFRISPLFISGHKPMIKKTTKKTILFFL